MGFPEDMELLKRLMKQLEVEYEQWFSGALPKPPVESKKRVEGIIRRYNVRGPQNLGEAAVFQMHQSKYNSYSEMWNRRVRLKEEGRLQTGKEVHHPPRAAAAPEEPSAQRVGGGAPTQQENAARAKTGAPARRGETTSSGESTYRKVFEDFVAARKKAGQGTESLNFESFKQQLTKQAEQLRTRGGYRDVDFGVAIKDGKASVVARPKR